MSDINSVIDKVKKLQRLATSSNINEAAAAAAAANKLIDSYRIQESDLEIEDEFSIVEQDEDFIYKSKKVTKWKYSLLSKLAKHYGCALFNNAAYDSHRKESRYQLFGQRSDIAICKYMFNYLQLECVRLSNLEAKGKGRIFVNSYCNGFVAGIVEQLNASRVELSKSASTQAMIKINSREKDAFKLMQEKIPNLKFSTKSFSSITDTNAFHSGMNKGKSLHLGSSLNSSVGGKLLGS